MTTFQIISLILAGLLPFGFLLGYIISQRVKLAEIETQVKHIIDEIKHLKGKIDRVYDKLLND